MKTSVSSSALKSHSLMRPVICSGAADAVTAPDATVAPVATAPPVVIANLVVLGVIRVVLLSDG